MLPQPQDLQQAEVGESILQDVVIDKSLFDTDDDDDAHTKKAGGGGRGGRKGSTSASAAGAAAGAAEGKKREVKVEGQGQGQGRGKPRGIEDLHIKADFHLHENLLQPVQRCHCSDVIYI